MALFQRKALPAPALSPPEPLPSSLPLQPSAAPKANDLEKQIRAVVWQHMGRGAELARSANLSLSELLEFISGQSDCPIPESRPWRAGWASSTRRKAASTGFAPSSTR
jgi:hypothetical protein